MIITRNRLRAGVAALALGLAAPALAQQGGVAQPQLPADQRSTAPSQQVGASQPVVAGQLRTAEQALRNARGGLSGTQPNIEQARTAVESGLNVLGQVPASQQREEPWHNAQQRLTEAKEALQGQQPNQQLAGVRMGAAADALARLATRFGDTAGTGTGMSGGGVTGGSSGAAQQPGAMPGRTR